MSNHYDDAYDPVSKTVRKACWMDGYFGKHRYGVQFDEGGPVYRPEEVAVPAPLAGSNAPARFLFNPSAETVPSPSQSSQ